MQVHLLGFARFYWHALINICPTLIHVLTEDLNYISIANTDPVQKLCNLPLSCLNVAVEWEKPANVL